MKQLIVFSALVFLMMSLISQPALVTKNHYITSKFEIIVIEEGVNSARVNGFFSQQIIDNMVAELTSTLGIDAADISINVTRTPKYKKSYFDINETINYDVAIPIDKLIVANSLFGISDADNSTVIHVKGSVQSELLPP